MIKKIKYNYNNFFKLIDVITKILKIADGNLKGLVKSITFSFINLISDLLSLGALFPLIYLILEKDSFFEKFRFLTKYEFINNFDENDLVYFFIFIVLFLIFLKFFISLSFNNFIWKYTYSVEKRLEKIVFNIVLNKKYDFFTRNPKGNLISLCKEETLRSMELTRSFIFGLVEAIALIIIIVFLLISFPATSILILFLLIFFSFLFITLIRLKSSGISKIRSDLHMSLIKTINQSFSAIKEIKFNNLQKQINKNFNTLNENLTKTDAKVMSIITLPRIFFEFLLLLSALSILFAFMVSNLDKSAMISNLTIFSLCAYRLFPAFSRIHVNYQQIRVRYNSLQTIHDFITFSKKNNETLNKPEFNEIDSKILLKLENLNFSFKNNDNQQDEIFKNLNFEIKKGQKIAIIGESGSGKSTLLELILSLLEPIQGKTTYNKLYYRDLDDFSDRTGYVYQEQIIFNDSLANNISLNFDKNKSDYDLDVIEKIYKSADNSLVSEFVPNSNLFNFQLTENGSNLSAGQRQRIYIARALFKAREMILFDEPTSNLDPNTERKIIQNIFENYKEIGLIMSTHRYSNFEKFDYIFNVRNGKLVKVDV